MHKFLMQMKVNEKSWFNICDQQVRTLKETELEEDELIDFDDEEEY